MPPESPYREATGMVEASRGTAPDTSRRRYRIFLLGLFLCWLLVYVPGLFRPALLDDADSVHAEAAKEMLQRGDWVTLHADGIRYL